MKTGRKSKIDVVLDNLEQIKNWKRNGATDEQIYTQLHISKTSWYQYLKDNQEFADAIKESVNSFVIDLKGELARQAFKHTLETKKVYSKVDTVTGHEIHYTEITKKEIDGNIGAIHLLLKNLDKENWSNDWQSYNLKKQELELRKKISDDKLFM